MNPKIDLQTAINDIKNIRKGYDEKEEGSPLLSENLKEIEMQFLNDFYEIVNKPASRKTIGKKKNKVMVKNP